jgi:polyisoprenoid-binding protein YceI
MVAMRYNLFIIHQEVSMRHPFLAVTAALTLMAGSACALVYTPPGTTMDGVQAGAYTIDPAHTNVLFSLSHMGFSHYYGRFDKISGGLNFDPKAPEKSTLNVTVDVASIDTNNAKLEGELKGAQWFDAAKFPTATFTSVSIEKTSATTGKLTGNLTLHGVTKPVVLDVTLNGAGQNVMMAVPELGFSATGTIKRSDFGISSYVPMVGDDVTLTIESELHGTPAAK